MEKLKEKKKMVEVIGEPYFYIYCYELEGTIEEMMKFLTERRQEEINVLAKIYPDTYQDILVVYEEKTDWDGDKHLESKMLRPETDEEFQARLQKNREIAKAKRKIDKEKALEKEAHDRKLYEELKLKYES